MIEKMSESEALLMLKVYERQEKIIKALLEEAIKKGNNQVALKKLYNEIQTSNNELKKYFKNYVQIRLSLIYEQSARQIEQVIKAFEIKHDKVSSFNRLDERTINILAKNTYESLNSINTVIGRKSQDFLRELGLRQSQGIIFGTDSWQKVAKNMTDELKKEGYFFIKYKDGSKHSAKEYSRMVARTTSAEANRAGVRDRMQEWGYDLVVINGISKNPDSPCIPYQGKTLSLSGKTEGYIKEADAVAAGLFHPNCIHSMRFSDENLI